MLELIFAVFVADLASLLTARMISSLHSKYYLRKLLRGTDSESAFFRASTPKRKPFKCLKFSRRK